MNPAVSIDDLVSMARMWAEGATVSAIADRHGRTKGSVAHITTRNRLFFPTRPDDVRFASNSWTEEQKRVVHEGGLHGRPIRDIRADLARLGRKVSESTVYQHPDYKEGLKVRKEAQRAEDTAAAQAVVVAPRRKVTVWTHPSGERISLPLLACQKDQFGEVAHA